MILVTGGTGLVGRHLVRTLIKKGHHVRCLVREPQKARELLPSGSELVQGEINDPVAVKDACTGVDKVINLVAIIREKGEDTFERINVEGTLNLVIAVGQANVKHFIQVSALGSCDDPKYKYAYSKWRGEAAVKQSGLVWTIVRPSVIYGEGFGFLNRLMQSLQMFPRAFVAIPGKGSTLFQPIAVEDVVRCLIRICEQPNMVGKTIEIGGPEHLSYVQILDGLMKQLGEKRYKLYIPLPLIRLVVPLLSSILQDPPVSPVELKQMELESITDLDAVEKNFGFRPKAFHDGLKYLFLPAK